MHDITEVLKAPFVWYGGKSKVAAEVWSRFGKRDRYVEPFFGSGAVLLANPYWQETFEVVNDLDHNLANAWRAIKYAPDEVAYYADQPTNEIELHLNHLWIVNEGRKRLKQCPSDESFYDAEAAGRWLWGMACWIGSNYASGNGPWTYETLALAEELGTYDIKEIQRQRPHLGSNGQGVNRKLPHLRNNGQGVKRKHELYEYLTQLSRRLRDVNVCCGDWTRVLGPSVTTVGKSTIDRNATCAVFLDPPYAADRGAVYTTESFSVAHDVREWCKTAGELPGHRIALCGHKEEHVELERYFGWTSFNWKASGGYSAQATGDSRGKANREKETIWFSPGCLDQAQAGLFPAMQEGV